MSGVRSRPILVGVLVLTSTACSSSLNPFIDDVSYRPPTAIVVSSADCLAQNIYTGLTGSGPWDPALNSDAPDPGYPPVFFTPVAVVRCERGYDETGSMTVDSVRLEGNIDAVDAAFSEDSKRFPDGVTASCAYTMEPPVGLWFVNEAGEAFRPAWPASPCGLQNAPVDALADLTEVSRSSHPTGIDDHYNTWCQSDPYGGGFENTTPEDVAAAEEREQAGNGLTVPSLIMPIDDVDRLQVCTVPTSMETMPPDSPVFVAGSSTTLSRAESASILRSIASAPLAPVCEQTSTRIASTQLRRPDGSGTSFVSFELDGCQRASGFGYYRAIPAGALAALRQTD